MISEEIKTALLKKFKKSYSISDEEILLFLDSIQQSNLIFEVVDYLESKHFSINTSMEFRRKRTQNRKYKEADERIKNKKTCLNKKAFDVLVDFIEKHKESGKYYPSEYNNTFKPLNLSQEQFREVWCTITDLGIEQILEDFKAKSYDSTGRMRYKISAVGVSFDNRQSIISKLEPGHQLRFVPEPNNAFDNHAVRIETNNGSLIGYVSKDYNTKIFNNLIEKRADYNPKVYEITGKNKNTLGVIIDLFITRLKDGVDITIDAEEVKTVQQSYIPQRKHLYYYETEHEETDYEEDSENRKADNGYLDDNNLDKDDYLKRNLPVNERDDYEDDDYVDYDDDYLYENNSYSDENDDYLDPEYYADEEDDGIELGDCDESGCY